jgi:hypothetical protein
MRHAVDNVTHQKLMQKSLFVMSYPLGACISALL